MRKPLFLCLALAALFLLAWDAHRWYEGRAAREPAFRSRATANELSGWQDSRQRWRLSAAEITRTDDGVDATGIGEGLLQRDGAAPLHFSAPQASYRKKNGLLRFSAGVSFVLDGKSLQVADGVYNDKAQSFHGSGVLFANGPESPSRWEVRAAGITYSHDGKQWQLKKEVSVKWHSTAGGHPCALATPLLILDEAFSGAVMPEPVALAGGPLSGAAANAYWDGDILTLHRVELRDERWAAALTAGTAARSGDKWVFAGGVAIRRDNGDAWRADRLELADGSAVYLENAAGTIGAVAFRAEKLLSDDRENYRTVGAVSVRPREDATLAADRLTFAERDERYFLDKPRLKQDNGTEISADTGLYDATRRSVTFTANVVTVRSDGREIRAAKAVYDLDSRVAEYSGAVRTVRHTGGEGEDR